MRSHRLSPGSQRTAPSAVEAVRNDRGGILAFVAVSLVVILGMVGLAVDSSRAFVVRAHLTRAVDASVLAAAREIRLGYDVAEDHARAVAAVNGVVGGVGGTVLSFGFSATPDGEQIVTGTAQQPMPTTFTRVLGFGSLTVRAAAVAAVPPVDLVLVLDQSGSMGRENCGQSNSKKAWQCLQEASKKFVDHFDEDIDQIAVASFQLRATDRFNLGKKFKNGINQAIDNTKADGDTNPGEGLRLALQQLQGPSVRSSSAKAIVFFTDGRPTAFRGVIGGRDRMMAVSTVVTGRVRGYFNDPDNLPSDGLVSPSGCQGFRSCFGWRESGVRNQATQNGTDMAEAIRDQDIVLYTIGLGNPSKSDPILVPDMDWLRMLANEGGQTDPDQPRGRAFFAESGEDLEEVFDLVAKDLLVRLAQ